MKYKHILHTARDGNRNGEGDGDREKEGGREPAAVGRQSTLQIKRRRTGGGRINLHLKAVFSSIFTTNRGPQL